VLVVKCGNDAGVIEAVNESLAPPATRMDPLMRMLVLIFLVGAPGTIRLPPRPLHSPYVYV